MKNIQEAVQYIISFLIGEPEGNTASKWVSYGEPEAESRIVIRPCGFFNDGVFLTPQSLPKLPLAEIEGVPLLFGKPQFDWKENVLYTNADIIASTYFLITRYEECIRRDVRDNHGRFIGKESLPYRAGFLTRPIVEEYGTLLRRWLRQTGLDIHEPEPGFSKIYLTHDVDVIWRWGALTRALRTVLARILRGNGDKLESLRAWWNYERYDDIYTFPWLMEQDAKAISYFGRDICCSVYFLMGGSQSKFDSGYICQRNRLRRLVDTLRTSSAIFGLHASYAASDTDANLILQEKRAVEEILQSPLYWNRHHYLRSREPEDMLALEAAGIQEDFTMGYADVAGFRLGTCRAVRWIEPQESRLTNLLLHPLTVMECTLESPDYMGMSEEEAFLYASKLMQAAYRHRGEISLLWHNNSLGMKIDTYQRNLYQRLLSYLSKMSQCWGCI